jgi:hypothetical protein
MEINDFNQSILNNYIPISRKLFKHWLWVEEREYSKFEAWLDLLQTARYKNTPAYEIYNSRTITWSRGQLHGAFRFLKNRWRWKSLGKVERFLELLVLHNMIVVETGQGTNIITICNYEKYNIISDSDEDADDDTDGDEHGTDTGQNSNKDVIKKKKGSNKGGGKLPIPTLEEVKQYFIDNRQGVELAKKAYNYYKDKGWKDKNGKEVKNWKTKMKNNWFSPIPLEDLSNESGEIVGYVGILDQGEFSMNGKEIFTSKTPVYKPTPGMLKVDDPRLINVPLNENRKGW